MALYLVHAHMENIVNPGSFQDSFNNIQKHLGATAFLTVNPNPDSTKLIKILTADAPKATVTTAPEQPTNQPSTSTSTTTRAATDTIQRPADPTKRKTKVINSPKDLVETTPSDSDADSVTTQTGFKTVRVMVSKDQKAQR